MRSYAVAWMQLYLLPSLLVAGLLHADEQHAASEQPTFDLAIRAAHLRPHVEFLASPELAGRSGRSKGQARKYIVEQWQAAKLRPLFSSSPAGYEDSKRVEQKAADALAPSVPSYEQSIPGPADAKGVVPIQGFNVGAWLPGSDPSLANEVVVIGVHYDHLGIRNGQIFAGADDNATGVAMMIEVARQLASDKVPPRRTVVFIGFDLEERMLWGSRWFAAHPPFPIERIKTFITADMIGRSLGDLPLSAVFVFGAEHAAELRSALNVIGTPSGLEVCRLGTDIVGTRSDYGPFRDRQIPYLFFSTGEHPDYHSPQDTADKIDYDKAAGIASLILKLTRQVADADQAPVWSEPVENDLEEPRILIRITELLLEADKKQPLTQTQRFFVTNVHNRAKQIVESNRMTSEERGWLVRMAQLLLLSVF